MKVIDELAMLDEDAAMIACLDPDVIAAGAARFFETAIQRQDARLILPSAARPSGWQLHICPRFFETDAAALSVSDPSGGSDRCVSGEWTEIDSFVVFIYCQ